MKETWKEKMEKGTLKRWDIPYGYTIVRCLENGKVYYSIYSASSDLGISCKKIVDSILNKLEVLKYRYNFEIVDIIYDISDMPEEYFKKGENK